MKTKTKNPSALSRATFLLMIVLVTSSCEKVDCLTIDCNLGQEITATSLVTVIKFYQDKYVRASTNEYDCFTDANLSEFRSRKTLDKIKAELLNSKSLKSLLTEVGKLSETDRNQLFKSGLATYQHTWAELGTISSKGQTTAGQTAQREIAVVVVSLVKEQGGFK
jgi:hypothetical protein